MREVILQFVFFSLHLGELRDAKETQAPHNQSKANSCLRAVSCLQILSLARAGETAHCLFAVLFTSNCGYQNSKLLFLKII